VVDDAEKTHRQSSCCGIWVKTTFAQLKKEHMEGNSGTFIILKKKKENYASVPARTSLKSCNV